jgi:hypothetical protein
MENKKISAAIDEALLPMYQHLQGFVDINGVISDDFAGVKMELEEVEIESPIQLQIIVQENGAVTLGSSPPVYYVETGVMPVFHQIKVKAVKTDSLH